MVIPKLNFKRINRLIFAGADVTGLTIMLVSTQSIGVICDDSIHYMIQD